jgi:type 2 lantibiotic biosynthesis protein LanM
MTGSEPSTVGIDRTRAERPFQHWKAQSPFGDSSYLTQRLAMDGLTEETFLRLLGEPIEAVRDRVACSPPWIADLIAAFSRPRTLEPLALAEPLRERPVALFLRAVEPLIGQGRDRLRTGSQRLLTAHPDAPIDPETIEEMLATHLSLRLLAMVARTMVLELHVARLEGVLEGETPEARFQSFVQRLQHDGTTLDLLLQYPVLARQLVTCVDQWVSASLAFLARLCGDWPLIRETFPALTDCGPLVALEGGAGDLHRGGLSVHIAHFQSGARLVYKPRSLRVDVHCQELLAWLDDRAAGLRFRTLAVLDRGTHGWVEYVWAGTCTSLEEVQRFYYRQGRYLALLYALEATDFHYENLIAAGEQPVLVDMEALFHPRMDGIDGGQADGLADHILAHSVLSVGLLPQAVAVLLGAGVVDMSGLGARAGQLLSERSPYLEAAGTDHMYIARRGEIMADSAHRPTLNGAAIEVLDFADQIAAGFEDTYRLLWRFRDDLLAPDGPLARFAHDEVRVLLRPTRLYSLLLRDGYHPDMLHDALDRDRLFDRLWHGIQQRPFLARVIPAERADLWRGDIPLFTTRPGTRDVWSSTGERIADYCETSGMALVRRRLQEFGDDDLSRQLWFVRASLATLAMGAEREQVRRLPHAGGRTRAEHGHGPLIAAACAVGDRLEALALRSNGQATWIGLDLVEDRWTLGALGPDLAAGIPGVALFLAYLGALTAEPRYTALAQAAVKTMRRQVQQQRGQPDSLPLGAFAGWGGIIHVLLHLAALWDAPAYIDEAEDLVSRVAPCIVQDELLDIMSGAAGYSVSLINLYRHRPSDAVRAAAVACGDRLIATAQPLTEGHGWPTPGAPGRALAGFSHGVAGIAWALLELAALTGLERFDQAAREALTYERSLFSIEAGNWPDLRAADATRFMTAWCHGAPGVGLARVLSLRHLNDDVTRREIGVALHTTLAQGFGHNHSLCHGALGNLDVVLQASHVLEARGRSEQVDRATAAILQDIDQHGWRCGVPLEIETPGLLDGIAGIGFQLLRLAEPHQVPSVLSLAPPPASTTGPTCSSPS